MGSSLAFILFLCVLNTAILGGVELFGIKAYLFFLILFFTYIFAFPKSKVFLLKAVLSVYSLIFLILLFSFLSTAIWSDWTPRSIEDFIKLLVLYCFSIFLYSALSSGILKLTSVYNALFISAILQLLVLFLCLEEYGISNLAVLYLSGQAYSGAPLFTEYSKQVFGESIIGNSQNIYSSFLVSYFFIFLLLQQALSCGRNVKFYIGFFAYSAIFIISLSKTSLVIYTMLTIYFLFYTSPYKGGVILLSLLLLGSYFGLGDLVVDRFEGMFNSANDVTISSRLNLWQLASSIIETNPFFGVGFRVANDVFTTNSMDGVNNPHNIFLRIWIDGGIVSLSIYLLLIILIFLKLLKVDVSKNNNVAYKDLNFIKNYSILYLLLFVARNMFAFQLTEFDFFLLFPIVYFVFYKLQRQ